MSEIIIGILASGRGSNMQAICNSIAEGRLRAKVGLVVSDKANARVLELAAVKGIPAVCIERKHFTTAEGFEEAIACQLASHRVELVVLAGFMRILSRYFVNLFPGSIMNIHPSLLPAFPGLNAHEQVIAYGAKVSGCTIHFVDEGMDTGPIIMQQAVAVHHEDTVETLNERILEVEHALYPQAIRLYCEQRLRVEGRIVKII